VTQPQKDGSLTQARSAYPTIVAAGKPLSRAEIINQIAKAEPAIYNGN